MNTINIEDINKMLRIMKLPYHLDPLFVAVVVRGDDWYPNEMNFEENVWYLTVNLKPDDVRKMGSEQFTVAVKDELMRYLETLELAA